MGAFRLCNECGRSNGLVFTHCIVCGHELPEPPADPPEVAADKAQRYLDGLDPERRRLLPPRFLRAVERQAGLAEDPSRTTGSNPSVSDSAEFRLSSIAGSRSFLGPRRRDHPADVVTQPDFPALVSPAFDLGSALADGEPPKNPTLPPEAEDPLWADPRDARSEDYPALMSDEAIPVMDHDLDDVHSFADLESVRVPVLKPTTPVGPPTNPTNAGLPAILSPLGEALREGTGAFGPRGAKYRLLMLPDPGYRSRIHFLQHRLSQTLEVDLFKARQYLQRELPTYLASGEDAAEIEGMAEHLRAGGVRVLLVHRDAWLRGAEPAVVVAAAGPPPGPVQFVREDGTELRVYRADLAWACIAEVAPLPEGSVTASQTWEEPAPTWMMDVVRHGSRSPIRVRGDRFDFGCLGDAATMATQINLRKLLAWLSPDEEAPLRLDDSFRRVPGAAGEAEFTEYVLLLDSGQRDVP